MIFPPEGRAETVIEIWKLALTQLPAEPFRSGKTVPLASRVFFRQRSSSATLSLSLSLFLLALGTRQDGHFTRDAARGDRFARSQLLAQLSSCDR